MGQTLSSILTPVRPAVADLGSLASLPPELLTLIFDYFDVRTLATISRVNSTFKSLVQDDKLWKRMFVRALAARDGTTQDSRNLQQAMKPWEDSHQQQPDWKQLYRRCFHHKGSLSIKPAFWKSPAPGRVLMGKMAKGKQEARILMVGLDAAGKTTMIYRMKLGEVVSTIPTIGFNVETVQEGNVSLVVWDVGGPDKLRPLWRHYYQDTRGIIFMVDSNDRERIEEASDELFKLLREDQLRDCPLLILANKQDLPLRLSVDEIVEKMGLKNIHFRYWLIQPTVATTGEGIAEGLGWLADVLFK